MFEFLSSPFGLVAVGLGVLAVAVLALCLWITTLDRRMRGMADGLETERRKVAELQMVIGRRANAARSYGNRGRAAAPAPPRRPSLLPRPLLLVRPCPHVVRELRCRWGHRAARPCPRGGPCRLPRAPLRRGARGRGSRPAAAGSGWTPSSIPMPAQSEVDAWVQGAPAVQQPIVVPDRKMSRKARREAERAFAARAAAELEARQARRAQEAAAAQRSFGAAPARAAAPARPAAAARPAAGVPAQAQGFAPVQPAYGAPSGARARHAR